MLFRGLSARHVPPCLGHSWDEDHAEWSTGQRDCDADEDVLIVDTGGEGVDGSEAQNQPIVVQAFLANFGPTDG